MDIDVPIYIFTGFLESGKTSFIKDTLADQDFIGKDDTLLIACEEGIEEYDEAFLKKCRTTLINIEDKGELSEEFFEVCNLKYSPDRIIVEYNGMWQLQDFLDIKLPDGWDIVQIITTIDATTFENYMNNMRSLVIDKVTNTDMVFFNRCTADTKKASFRRSVKAVNRQAQIIYENQEGIDESEIEDDLPFDLNSDIVEIEDDDFGLWYVDALDNPKKYDGKKVSFTGMVYKNPKMKSDTFVPGRFAMTCCVEDISFVGFICKSDKSEFLNNKDWIKITALVKSEFRKEYKGKGPVLYEIDMKKGKEPEEKIVYFN